ncbi:hypothetical protein [Actinokineospora alba]|nr:hypothetical protein [Actinokineospora alba]
MSPDDWQRPIGRPSARLMDVRSWYGVVATAEERHVVNSDRRGAVVTRIDGAQSLVTAFDAASTAVTSDLLGHVPSNGHGCEQRLGVYVQPCGTPTLTLGHDGVRLGDSILVGLVGDRAQVKTARLHTMRDKAALRIGLSDAEPRVVYGFGTGEMRARTGDRETVARVDSDAAQVGFTDDVELRVTRSDHAEVRRQGTTFVLDPDTGRTKFTCADGLAEIASPAGFDVRCARTGWRVTASRSLVMIESFNGQMARIVWNQRTGELEALVCAHRTLSTKEWPAEVHACDDCGEVPDALWRGSVLEFELAGLRVRWSDGTLEASAGDGLTVSGASAVRVRWGGKNLAMDGERVLVSDVDEDWYVTADGRLATGASTVSAGRAIDGTLELAVRSAGDDETTLVWARGVCLDDGRGLRMVLDASGRVVCTPTSRADHSVIASPSGIVKITAETATVDLAGTGAVRLRDSGVESGLAQVIAHSHRSGRGQHATITCYELFSLAPVCSASTLPFEEGLP